jgi:hypothetical protein
MALRHAPCLPAGRQALFLYVIGYGTQNAKYL